jgi:NAD(P)-dependent dehydrogenase (short-subunit alcohol dehydrogenase family)
MYYQKLKNKVIVVTGGSGGIGNSIVKKFASCDANVVAVYNQNLPTDCEHKRFLGYRQI